MAAELFLSYWLAYAVAHTAHIKHMANRNREAEPENTHAALPHHATNVPVVAGP